MIVPHSPRLVRWDMILVWIAGIILPWTVVILGLRWAFGAGE